MAGVLSEIWDRATTAQPVPTTTVVALTGLAALLLVAMPATWHRVRLGITVVHEGGHALVGVLVGRRLQGIRLHADTSGLTVSRGRPTGPGMLVTLLAGYLAPALVGLGAALLLTGGYALGLLWLSVVLMAAMLVWIRNVYGFLVLVVGIAAAGTISWYGAPATQAACAYLLVWLLLLAAPR
ncbi:MAG: M50 family metallopeptidase, partial [Solirubrobacteraceae bacterium]